MIPDIQTPDARKGVFASAFQRGSKERALRLVIDWESIGEGVVREVLSEVSAHPLIETIGTRKSDGYWVEIPEPTDPQMPDGAVVWRGDDIVSLRTIAFGGLPPAPFPDAAGRWRTEAGLAHFTKSASFDALVTESPGLFGRFATLAGGRGIVLTPPEGIALAGLYLRSRGEFNKTPRRRGLIDWRSAEDFYQALAAVHVPAMRLWLGAARPQRSRDLYEETCALALSIGRQIARTFRARDKLQILRRGEITGDTACDVASEFELALVSLSGAFDGLASLAALVYGLKKRRTEGWIHKTWLTRLASNPETRRLAKEAGGEEVQATLAMLAEMRNTVHGPTLEPRVFVSSRDRRAVVAMPPTRVPGFQDILSRWGGAAKEEEWWGVEYHRRGPDDPARPNSYTATPDDPVAEIWIDAGVCLERLLVFALAAIDGIGSAIDWSRLPRAGAGFLPLRNLPPGDERFQERIVLLGGVWI